MNEFCGKKIFCNSIFSFWRENRKILMILFFTALLIRLVFFGFFWHNNGLTTEAVVVGDGVGYHNLALDLLGKGEFPSTQRTPLYSLFVAIVYLLFGIRPWVVILIQILLDAAVCFLIYRLILTLYNNKKLALTGGLLYAIDPLAIIYSFGFFSDAVFVFLFVLSLCLLFLGLTGKKLFLFGLSGLVLGLATLDRPVTLYFPLVVLAVIILARNQPKFNKLKAIIIFMMVFELAILPWQVRNFVRYNNFSLSSIQGYILVTYNAAYTEANISKISEKEAREKLEKDVKARQIDDFQKSKLYQKIAIDYIKKHPKEYLKVNIRGTFNLFFSTEKYLVMRIFGLERQTNSDEDKISFSEGIAERFTRVIKSAQEDYYLTIILSFVNLVEYFLAIIGLGGIFLKKYRRVTLVLLMMIAYYVLIIGAIGWARYRLPIIPIYLVLAVQGLLILNSMFKLKIYGQRGNVG